MSLHGPPRRALGLGRTAGADRRARLVLPSGGLWRMTFADEFDGPGVDASKWSNGFGWGDTANNFAAWCDPTANAVVDGVLVQRADRLPAPVGGKGYSGACLHTKGT